jgi:hypothetical protein
MSDSTENTSKPSYEQLEARVVAMLLGEASPFEEEQLREQLKGDAALAKFCAEIGETLPLLNEALDVGQAPEAKSPKMRLARKRRGKLKLLFRSDTGLAKRRIFRVEFRKALAIAAAVCAVLLVAAGLLLPNLAKSKAKAGSIAMANKQSNEQFGERAETEEETRAGIEDNFARAELRLLSPSPIFPGKALLWTLDCHQRRKGRASLIRPCSPSRLATPLSFRERRCS